MNHGNETKLSKEVAVSGDKKPYAAPMLHAYGALHLTTQASGPTNGDAGKGMMA